MRPIVIHYHIYKNAGTSVDACLQDNFGEKWAAFESEDNRILQAQALEAFIQDNPELQAISSHTAQICLPKLPDVHVIPIIFLRHPIDRIRSVYEFERNDVTGEGLHLKYAQTGNFEDYYIWRMTSFTPWQITNFQSFKFKDFFEPIAPVESVRFRANCVKALEALDFVGVVEDFDQSMKTFETQIQSWFPEFGYDPQHKNAADARKNELNARLNDFRQDIGAKLYLNLLNLNCVDFECYNHLVRMNGRFDD